MKKVLSSVLALMLALGLLAGCQKENTETTAPAEPAAPVETPAEPAAPAETPAAPAEEAPAIPESKSNDDVAAELKAVSDKVSDVAFASDDESFTVTVTMAEDATEEDITAVDAKAEELLTEAGYIQNGIFENTDKALTKSSLVEYKQGETVTYSSTSGFYSRKGRNAMTYLQNKPWDGPKAVEAAE